MRIIIWELITLSLLKSKVILIQDNEKKLEENDGEIVLKIASPEHAAQIVGLYDTVFRGKYPLKGFLNEQSVAEMIREGNQLWYLALNKERIIGSAVGIIHDWNNSFEIGRTAVMPDYANCKIAKTLCKTITDKGFQSGLEICIGRPRNDAIYKVSQNDGLKIVGFLPGCYEVEYKETYLLGYRLSGIAKEKRIAHQGNQLYCVPPISNLIEILGLENVEGGYPTEVIVGPQSGQKRTIEFKSHTVGHSITILKMANIERFIKDYIQLDVLIDKTEMIDFLKRFGFKMCAFLPAWFEKDEERYDCIRMVNSTIPPIMDGPIVNKILEDLIKEFEY